jgi:hypothetical protein
MGNPHKKASPGDGRVKLTPEVINALLVAIMQEGSVKKAVKLLPVSISASRIFDKRREDPSFDIRINRAIRAYNAGNPDKDIEKVVLLDDLFLETLRLGETETIAKLDPKDRKTILELTNKQKRRFDPRLWEIIHPKKVWSEASVLMVTANQLHDIQCDPELSEQDQRTILKWLPRWICKATEELQKNGLPLKYLEKTE